MKKILILAASLVLLGAAEIIRELKTFKVTHYQIHSPKLSKEMPEKKVALISDLHNCVYGKGNEKLLKAIKEEEPDLILVAGDILVGKKEANEDAAVHFINELKKIAHVCYGNGNHEQRMKEQPKYYGTKYQEYKQAINGGEITFLENETMVINWEEDKTAVTGLEIPKKYYEKFLKHGLKQEEIEERIGKPDKETYQILIAHNPVYAKEYAKWGADLIVSGHLHGGIVRLPFPGGAVSPQISFFPRYSGGCYKVGDADLVVSKGLGTHTINIRLFNEAEVVMLHINGEK